MQKVIQDANVFISTSQDENDYLKNLQNLQGNLGGYNLDANELIAANFYLYSMRDITKYCEVLLVNTNGRVNSTLNIWTVLKKVVKCVLGTLGGAGLGLIAGASLGKNVTFNLGPIGTVAASSVGAISGAMSGASASCYNLKNINGRFINYFV